MLLKTIRTSDGSYTLYNETLKETYHSVHGALGESLHVYIENGLKRLLKQEKTIHILEVGFGTGMNALLTMDQLLPGTNMVYHSLEPYPLEDAMLEMYYSAFAVKPDSLPYLKTLNAVAAIREIAPGFVFQLHPTRLEDIEPNQFKNLLGRTIKADLVYFDAFAPSKQAEMWSIENLNKIKQCMEAGSVLVSYCAQGQFKRNLKALGFEIESPPGAHGKREMTVAVLK